MPDGQVTGVEPAAFERFGSGARVLQVALHDGVTAYEDLTDRLAVTRGWLQRCAIADHQAFQRRVAHALSRLDLRPLLQGKLIPFGVPGADRHRAIGFGQAKHMGDLDAHLFDGTDDFGRWRSARDQGIDRVIDGRFR
ncbi:hypothetical protein D3C86_1796790 [compost metagenome]